MADAHSVEERLESGILAHRIEFNGGGDQNQGTVALLEGAIQPVEETLEIRQAKVDEGEPHRRDVAVRGACAQLAEVLVSAVAVSRTGIDIAEDAYVIDGPAA